MERLDLKRWRSPWKLAFLLISMSIGSFCFAPPGWARDHDLFAQAERDLAAYHSYEALYRDLQQLESKYPAILRIEVIGQSHGEDGNVNRAFDNRDIIAVKISDKVYRENDGLSLEEPDVLFVGGQHAREWISVEVSFLLIEHLVEYYERDPTIKRLVDGSEIWVVPMANPDGVEYSRAVERLWRKSRSDNGNGSRGVDLNRNFPYPLGIRWNDPLPAGTLTSDSPDSELFRGTSPFSEPESMAMRDLVRAHQFRAAINFHSYGQTILYPWGIAEESASDESLLREMATRMAELMESVHGTKYRPTKSYNLTNPAGGAYRKHGEMSDWLYAEGVLAFTFELRPQTYGEGGFTLPPEKIQPTFEEVLPASLYLIETAMERVGVPGLPALPGSGTWKTMEEALDANGNRFLDEDELLELVDYWISGQIVPGTGQVISDEQFFYFLNKWIEDQPLVPLREAQSPLVLSRATIVQRDSWLRLQVDGTGIEKIELQLFNLAGQQLIARSQSGSELQFRVYAETGNTIANGVYLYLVTAYGAGGDAIQSKVQKFVVLR